MSSFSHAHVGPLFVLTIHLSAPLAFLQKRPLCSHSRRRVISLAKIGFVAPNELVPDLAKGKQHKLFLEKTMVFINADETSRRSQLSCILFGGLTLVRLECEIKQLRTR